MGIVLNQDQENDLIRVRSHLIGKTKTCMVYQVASYSLHEHAKNQKIVVLLDHIDN